jgi:hypothetical protein
MESSDSRVLSLWIDDKLQLQFSVVTPSGSGSLFGVPAGSRTALPSGRWVDNVEEIELCDDDFLDNFTNILGCFLSFVFPSVLPVYLVFYLSQARAS